MKKSKIDRDVVFLLVSTLITIGSWVGFEVYRAYIKVGLPSGIEKHLVEIMPVLKTEVLDTIEKRVP